MAQIIPSITSLPIDSSAAPSVEDIQDRLPSICVDYLSHDWSEEDVWASWRSMTRHKHEIANGVRLENASWRTWQKQRNKLKTISPETLNWLKDSDVTWLYGPLHTAQVEPVRPHKVSSTGDKYGLDEGSIKTKPILKHRTLSEMLTIHSPSSPILEASSRDDSDDGELNRPPLVQTKSDTNIVRVRTGGLKGIPAGAAEAEPTAPNMTEQDSTDSSIVPEVPSTGKKHISFNTFVEQVIAVDDPSEGMQDDSDSSDNDMLTLSSSRSSSRSRPSFSRNSSSASGGSNGEHLTIAKIAPTMLKTNGVYHSSLPAMVYAPPPEYRSPQAEQASMDFPSPQAQKVRPWADEDDEDYSSVGYDYYPTTPSSTAAPSHVVRSGSSPQAASGVNATLRPPAATLAPPDSSSLPTSISSSNSSSSATISTSPSQPSRSILKVRPAGSPAKDESPPTTPAAAEFNYTPSAATGIGGMRSAGHENYALGASPSSPGVLGAPSGILGGSGAGEERGRSTSRGPQTSAYGRSSSGSASVGSTSSISPGGPRVHNELPIPKQQKVAQPPTPSLGQVVEGNPGDETRMDIDSYSPERSGTPTPHSSPQIAFRPLKDTSPASLPHHPDDQSSSTQALFRQFEPPSANATGLGRSNSTGSRSNPNSNRNSPQSSSPELPKADPLRVVSPVASTRTTSRATTAHVGTNAAPTLANNSEPSLDSLHRASSNTSIPSTGQSNTPAYGRMHRHHRHGSKSGSGSGNVTPNGPGSARGGDDDSDEDEDGSSIMGRAANIATTAKGILGALWYGANDNRNGLRRHGNHS